MRYRLILLFAAINTLTAQVRGNDFSAATILEKSGATVVRDEAKQDHPITQITLPLAAVTPESVGALKEIEELPAIELVGMGSSDLTPELLQALQQFRSLKRLTIAFARISDETAARLGTLRQLESLQLQRRIEASPEAVESILKLPGLKELTISGKMVNDETLQQISAMSALRSLGLESPFVTDYGIQSLRRLRQLRSLNIYIGEEVSNAGIGQLAELSLSDVHITLLTASNERLKSLRKISGLKDLKLVSAQHVNDNAIPHLLELTELETLILSDARLSNAGLKELRSSLPKCQIQIDNRPRD